MSVDAAHHEAANVMVIGTRAETMAVDRDLRGVLAVAPVLVEAASARAALEMLRRSTPHLIVARLASLCDLAPTIEDAVGRLAKGAADALLVGLAEGASVSTTLAVMGAGAHDCLRSPFPEGVFGTRVVDLARRYGKATALAGRPAPAPATGRAELADALAEMHAAYQQIARIAADPSGRERRPAVLPMWQQEQRIIEEAIASFDGNIALAAAALEISPSTIYRKRQSWAEAAAQVA